ncbi:hypothetical protein DL93DRAFT_2089276 [Clavulina sp. PMI_390]|nr:hypothetical protein DL93DRAFT_2089276 [Clavulina sp. PMI_390]
MRFLGKWVLVRPGLDEVGHGGMGAGYMLLFYGTERLRVVITSTAITRRHWDETSNVVWVQDFAIKSAINSNPSPPLATRFTTTLANLLTHQRVHSALQSLSAASLLPPTLPTTSITALLSLFDFSRVKVALVASIPGKYDGWPAVMSVGHTGLMSTVNDLGMKVPKGSELSLDYLTSSLAPYTTQWLRQFEISAEGGDGHQKFMKLSSKARAALPVSGKFGVVYPTQKSIESMGPRLVCTFDSLTPNRKMARTRLL